MRHLHALYLQTPGNDRCDVRDALPRRNLVITAVVPMLPRCCSQVHAELNTAETSLATATAERLQLQQELNTKSDQLMLLESELRLKASRLDAAQQQLSTEAEEHAAERALLQRQLEQLVVSCVVMHTQTT
jgi:hypothetical protein